MLVGTVFTKEHEEDKKYPFQYKKKNIQEVSDTAGLSLMNRYFFEAVEKTGAEQEMELMH